MTVEPFDKSLPVGLYVRGHALGADYRPVLRPITIERFVGAQQHRMGLVSIKATKPQLLPDAILKSAAPNSGLANSPAALR